jgi:hypothetical protein
LVTLESLDDGGETRDLYIRRRPRRRYRRYLSF